MKTIYPIFLSLCLFVAGCVTPAPEPVRPVPPVPPVQPVPPPAPPKPPKPEPPKPPVVVMPVSSYLITQFDENGASVRTWEVDSYTEKSFPNRVTFEYDGKTVTVDGSFQIDRKIK